MNLPARGGFFERGPRLIASQAERIEVNAMNNIRQPLSPEMLARIKAEKKRVAKNLAASIEKQMVASLLHLPATGKRMGRDTFGDILPVLSALPNVTGRWLRLKLTPREIEVCRLIQTGRSSRSIARRLRISLKTVEGHRDAIRRKIGIKRKKINLQSLLGAIGL